MLPGQFFLLVGWELLRWRRSVEGGRTAYPMCRGIQIVAAGSCKVLAKRGKQVPALRELHPRRRNLAPAPRGLLAKAHNVAPAIQDLQRED
ncbi:MAG: hypothetical protein COZ57_36555 [Armatimonadetes bacterium CG_4_8_14_3_um_filter_66_20]|nr:MAG: hypothetical protein COZ57_36555 [Armatimonadetes bacterium CG_4_8_14_3_um_filter_66_20]